MKGIMFTSLAALIGLVFVCFTIPPLIRVVNALRLFEPIGGRKSHKQIVPTIGGVSIFIGFTLSSFIASNGYSMTEIRYIYPAIILMFFIGLKDDIMILPARKKLEVQIITAIMLATLGNIRLTSLYGILGIWQLDYFTGAFISAFLIVAFINAFNFIDGIDGLASGIGIIISATFGTCFILMQRFDLSIVSFSLTGSLIAFFKYNVFGVKYKLFMGDTGSLIIGTILAALAIKIIEVAPASNLFLLSKSAPTICVGVLIIPIIDLIRIFTIRIWNGKSPFSPDDNHIHHKILSVFPNHLTVTLIMCGVNILFIGFTFLLIYSGLNNNYIITYLLIAGFLSAYLPFKYRKGSLSKHVQLKPILSSIHKLNKRITTFFS